ncbi:MAG: hypothetical protein ACLR2E_14970 [Lachnospiraceae bacterium]
MRKIQKQGVAADGIAAVGLGNQNVGFTRRKGEEASLLPFLEQPERVRTSIRKGKEPENGKIAGGS